jgi:outer membrane protein OmpA-like peptidoglycan-associated protein
VLDKTDISRARIDSLIKEAELIINELKTINPRTRQELIITFDYNSFELSENDESSISSLLDKVETRNDLTILLEAFSGEGYSTESERLISNKRIHTIKEYLKNSGIPPLEISVRNHSIVEDIKKFENEAIGVVKITFKL